MCEKNKKYQKEVNTQLDDWWSNVSVPTNKGAGSVLYSVQCWRHSITVNGLFSDFKLCFSFRTKVPLLRPHQLLHHHHTQSQPNSPSPQQLQGHFGKFSQLRAQNRLRRSWLCSWGRSSLHRLHSWPPCPYLSLSLSHFKALFGCWEMKGKIKWFFIFLITIGLLLQRKWKEREGKSDFWTFFVFVFWSW